MKEHNPFTKERNKVIQWFINAFIFIRGVYYYIHNRRVQLNGHTATLLSLTGLVFVLWQCVRLFSYLLTKIITNI